MYIYTYTHICTYTHAYTHTFAYICICDHDFMYMYCTHARTHICIHIDTHVCVYMYMWTMYTCIHTHTYIYTHTSTDTYICTNVCAYTHTYAYTHVISFSEASWLSHVSICVYVCMLHASGYAMACVECLWVMVCKVWHIIRENFFWLAHAQFLGTVTSTCTECAKSWSEYVGYSDLYCAIQYLQCVTTLLLSHIDICTFSKALCAHILTRAFI
jgi:hypothetical protein